MKGVQRSHIMLYTCSQTPWLEWSTRLSYSEKLGKGGTSSVQCMTMMSYELQEVKCPDCAAGGNLERGLHHVLDAVVNI